MCLNIKMELLDTPTSKLAEIKATQYINIKAGRKKKLFHH